jgi:hypothetical protein
MKTGQRHSRFGVLVNIRSLRYTGDFKWLALPAQVGWAAAHGGALREFFGKIRVLILSLSEASLSMELQSRTHAKLLSSNDPDSGQMLL